MQQEHVDSSWNMRWKSQHGCMSCAFLIPISAHHGWFNPYWSADPWCSIHQRNDAKALQGQVEIIAVQIGHGTHIREVHQRHLLGSSDFTIGWWLNERWLMNYSWMTMVDHAYCWTNNGWIMLNPGLMTVFDPNCWNTLTSERNSPATLALRQTMHYNSSLLSSGQKSLHHFTPLLAKQWDFHRDDLWRS